MSATTALCYRLAGPDDDDAIHRLNYVTFVDEIPQHTPNAERRLVDRFHAENTYALAIASHGLAGMVCGRCTRPFSLDGKLAALDGYLPPHRRAVEIRLLAIDPRHRKSAVFGRLMAMLCAHFVNLSCDLALISGTVRQLPLYRHLGFQPFAAPVGSLAASYQPMYLTLDALRDSATGRAWMDA